MEKVVADSWSSLQVDLLCLIGEKIELIEDFVSFCGVCRFWYVSGTELYRRKKKLDFNYPFYTPGFDPLNPKPNFCRYQNYMVDSPRQSWGSWWRNMIMGSGWRCWGSQFGWLVTYSPRNHEFSLLNPVSGATISLPPFHRSLFDLKNPRGIKAFLTADPVVSPDDCIVLVSHGISPLAFSRPAGRNRAWYGIASYHSDRSLWLADVMPFRGGLYGIVQSGDLNVFHVVLIEIEPSPRVVELVWRVVLGPGDPAQGLPGRDLDVDYFTIPWAGAVTFPINSKYIVELEGELCVVFRYMVRDARKAFVTGYFKVFRVDLSTGKLARVWSLGDRCLFLGNGNTFACKLGDSKSNLVFYTDVDDVDYIMGRDWDNKRPRYRDEGVWDMLTSQNIYSSTDRRTKYQSSLWFVPSAITFKTLEQLEQQVEELITK